jgi:hypothetical protein
MANNPKPQAADAERAGSTNQPNQEVHMADKPQIKAVPDNTPAPESNDTTLSIAKPEGFSLDKFKSKRAVAMANVETLQTALPTDSIAQAKDFVRLHPDEENYWSDELCFVSVPIKGQKRDTLHLIDEELAMRYLPSAKVLRFRLALASKPYDAFFLCRVPTRNLDNGFNSTNLQGCEQAKRLWTQVTSRKEENVELYKVDKARDPDAFPEPKWPTQSLDELIGSTFDGRMITSEDHPALRRLIGARQTS